MVSIVSLWPCKLQTVSTLPGPNAFPSFVEFCVVAALQPIFFRSSSNPHGSCISCKPRWYMNNIWWAKSWRKKCMAWQQSDHKSGGETAPAPKEGPTRSPESRPGSSRQGLSSAAWAQLLQTMCRMPARLASCLRFFTACRQTPWLVRRFCCILLPARAALGNAQRRAKQWYSDPWVGPRSLVQWLEAGGTLGLRFEEPKTPIMACYADGKECAQPTGSAKASPWISHPAGTFVPGPKVSDLTVRWKGRSLGSQPSRKVLSKRALWRENLVSKRTLWRPNLPKSCHLMHMCKVISKQAVTEWKHSAISGHWDSMRQGMEGRSGRWISKLCRMQRAIDGIITWRCGQDGVKSWCDAPLLLITYLSSPSKVAKAIAIPVQCVTIRLYTPKCSGRCDFLKLSLCLWETNFGGLGAKLCALAESALDCVEARGAEGNITRHQKT